MLRTVLRNALYVLPLNSAITGVYIALNRHPVLAPHILPLTFVDSATPLLIWTVFPYYLLLFSDILLPLLIKDREIFFDTLRGYSLAMILDAIIWTLYPTTYPRPEVALESSFTSAVYRTVVELDTPVCCLPSAHITIPAVGCWGLARQYPTMRPLIWITFSIFSLTILTTKQHYLVDLVAGLCSAALGVNLSLRWARRNPKIPLPVPA